MNLEAFDLAWVRFCTSGILLTFRCVADYLNRRRGRRGPPTPKWAHGVLAVALLVFYGLIGPAGGALFSGYGNLAGIGMVFLSLVVSHIGAAPALVLGRALFYLALPVAVGVPWGLAALSLPMVAAMAWTHRSAPRVPGEGVVAT